MFPSAGERQTSKTPLPSQNGCNAWMRRAASKSICTLVWSQTSAKKLRLRAGFSAFCRILSVKIKINERQDSRTYRLEASRNAKGDETRAIRERVVRCPIQKALPRLHSPVYGRQMVLFHRGSVDPISPQLDRLLHFQSSGCEL